MMMIRKFITNSERAIDMSKYDSIKTAADLVAEVQAHGLSTVQDDINRAADIFGNDTIENLVRLANDIGRNNEIGEPDPKGSWSSSRRATQGTFYMIASAVWNWEEVTRFWNLHTNPEHDELTKLRNEGKELRSEVQKLKGQIEEEHTNCLAERAMAVKLKAEKSKLAADLHDAKMNEMELKAHLYDLMMAEKEERQ